MFLSTNSLSIVYTFSWEYISIFKPERNSVRSTCHVLEFANQQLKIV